MILEKTYLATLAGEYRGEEHDHMRLQIDAQDGGLKAKLTIPAKRPELEHLEE